MKAIERHLYSRHGHFYYRSAIPRRYQAILSIRETVIALGPLDRHEARVLVAQLKQAEEAILRTFQENASLAEESEQGNLILDVLRGLEGLKGKCPHSPALLNQAIPESKKRGKIAPYRYSEMVHKYLQDCSHDAPRTLQQKEATFQLFRDLYGDKPLQEISLKDATAFKEALLKLPVNAKKILQIDSFEGVNIESIEGGKTASIKTINGRLAVMRTLFNWAERAGYYTGKNPFSGLMIRGGKNAANKRPSFKPDEITILFKSPLYKGCMGPKWAQRIETGNYGVIKDALYWIPLIGLYSGMRLNEICQLDNADIRLEEGVWVFDINDSDNKRLKTASSTRLVPVHDKLIDAGLIQYLAVMNGRGEKRAFPDLSVGVHESLSAPFSKKFRRLLNVLELTREGLCFHSLRHTFIDGLRNAGVERAVAMVLTGHQSSAIHDHYGNGYNLRILQEGLNKVIFPVLDLGD